MIGVYPTFRHLTLVLGLLAFTLGVAPAQGQGLPGRFPVTWSTGENGLLDRGTGIAFLTNQPGYGRVKAETLLVRARPTSSAEITGAFLYQETRKGIAWRYGVAAPTRLRPNLLEYGYEMSGVPLDRITRGEKWARVILGFDAKGRPYLGWVALDSTRVRYLLWKNVLAGNPVFFLAEESPQFHDHPGGKEVLLGIRPGDNSDYIMHPLETQGSWLRVRVAQPSDLCGGPDDGVVRNTVVWIRYLTPKGRPKVWYYTRGC